MWLILRFLPCIVTMVWSGAGYAGFWRLVPPAADLMAVEFDSLDFVPVCRCWLKNRSELRSKLKNTVYSSCSLSAEQQRTHATPRRSPTESSMRVIRQ
jgi:hypothetical protein